MKLFSILSVSAATVGMICLVGYASAANSAPGDLISDSILMAQSTPSPGGRGGGTQGEVGRADKNTQSEYRLQGTPGTNTTPEKVKPGTKKDAGTGGKTGSDRERTGKSSGNPEPSSDAESRAK